MPAPCSIPCRHAVPHIALAATLQGGDRWQPPDIPNGDEVLVRPKPEEEDATALSQPASADVAPSDNTSPSAAALAAAAAPAEERLVEIVATEEERGQDQHQHQHRHRHDPVHMLSVVALFTAMSPQICRAHMRAKACACVLDKIDQSEFSHFSLHALTEATCAESST